MTDDARSPIVDALIDAFVDGWNRHDATTLSAVFSPDADLVNFRGRRLSGTAEIHKFLAHAFAQNLKESRVEITERRVRFVADAAGAFDLTGTITGIKDPTGAARPTRGFRCDGTLAQNPKGGWWVVVGHLREGPLDAKPPASRPTASAAPADPDS